jgi:hypothetical protein
MFPSQLSSIPLQVSAAGVRAEQAPYAPLAMLHVFVPGQEPYAFVTEQLAESAPQFVKVPQIVHVPQLLPRLAHVSVHGTQAPALHVKPAPQLVAVQTHAPLVQIGVIPVHVAAETL